MKTTKANIMYRNDRVIQVGYEALCETMRMVKHGRDFYTCGYLGWNADIYEFGQFAICTGYRPFGHDSLPIDFIKRWEKKSAEFYRKCFNKKPDGTYRTSAQIERMKITYCARFEKAVMAELEKQDKQKKQKKMRKAA